MSKTDDVPEWALDKVHELYNAEGSRGISVFHSLERAFARYIAAHEPAPVDPLREALSWSISQHLDLTPEQIDDITDELRARGVTAPQAQDNRP